MTFLGLPCKLLSNSIKCTARASGLILDIDLSHRLIIHVLHLFFFSENGIKVALYADSMQLFFILTLNYLTKSKISKICKFNPVMESRPFCETEPRPRHYDVRKRSEKM